MVAEMGLAFHTAPKSHFRHAVVIVDLASPNAAQFIPDGIRDSSCSAARCEARTFHCLASQAEDLGWDSYQSINAFPFHDLECLVGIADGTMSNSHRSQAVQCRSEQIAHAAGRFSGQKD